MKLKCNRERPCSNCANRGVLCERAYSVNPQGRSSSSGHNHEEILSRIERLEKLVGRSGGLGTNGLPDKEISVQCPVADARSHIIEEEGDTRWLEGVGTRGGTLLPGLSSGITFQAIPIQVAIEQSTSPMEAVKNVWLPPKREALWLFEDYTEHVAYLHHIVHIPTVRNIIHNLYRNLQLGLPIQPSHVALLLSMFASTAYMLSSSNCSEVLFSNLQNAIQCSFLWCKSALDVLEHSNRTTAGSIEDIQATIILAFVVFNFEGFTARFRILSSSALSMARDLALHRIDAEVQAPRTGAEKPIQVEIKRRVWWHMVSTDWLLALAGGPQEGTYLIHPAHMRVCYPRNIDDLDDVDDVAAERHTLGDDPSLSQPTAMTYSILRIRLAEICRSVVDAVPPQFTDWGRVNYDDIITLDGQFEQYLRDLPSFFCLDEASLHKSREIDQKYPQLAVQRYIICSTFHSRRFKLNQPFLIRASSDGRYKYSREACLRSARTVIKIKWLLEHDGSPFASTHVRLATFLHTLFLATAVLVMDLCVNKNDGMEQESARWAEVVEACRMLQEAEKKSPMATKFLEPLVDILKKYHTQLPFISSSSTAALLPLSAAPSYGISTTTGLDRPSVNPTPMQSIPSIQSDQIHADAVDTNGDLKEGDIFNPNSDIFDEMWRSFIDMDQHIVPLVGLTDSSYLRQPESH
ncbi:predicted protein [Uncinocarpus reesii 1704]|uniref:C6 finger domain transcription factor nscR n=1 Tax=Uncinocarpus reesii (strain UAMH 1704) TaxID=336963 RepID=C4JH23_UNCRE|nr:uncharacterized protein UREG_01274 [Uncinocarpus reesii 1704]EEP76425.1 predicted protein [Uncinocarpus reesii 1704]